MHIEFGQKVIDFIRGKKPFSWKDELLKTGAKVIDNDIILLPNGVKMHFTKELEYILYEIYVTNDYMFFDDKDTIFIDIGMNVASTTLYFACKPNVKNVYSFEPFPFTYTQATENINLNTGFSGKVKTYNFGLSNKDETITIPYCKQETGCMSIKNDKERLDRILPKGCTVENVTIDIKDAATILGPIIQEGKDNRVVIKMDTEGSEYEIFESLESAKLFEHIDVILLEYHKGYKEIEDTLLRNDFVVFYKDNRRNEKVGMIYAVKNSRA